jgi:hypothetical protein
MQLSYRYLYADRWGIRPLVSLRKRFILLMVLASKLRTLRVSAKAYCQCSAGFGLLLARLAWGFAFGFQRQPFLGDALEVFKLGVFVNQGGVDQLSGSGDQRVRQ